MKKTILTLIILSFTFIFLGASCVKVRIAESGLGVFKSFDKGESWQAKNSLFSLGPENKTLTGAEVTVLFFDPQDPGTIYLGTKSDGLFASYDGGESWQLLKKVSGKSVQAVAVDPRAKQIVYFATSNQIFKSSDCNRSWQTVYLETIPELEITDLAIDNYDSAKIYAGFSDGRLIRSNNGGSSWVILNNFQSSVKQILINPQDTRLLYVVTSRDGIFRSNDLGATWHSLDKSLEAFYGARDIAKGVFDPTKKDALIIATQYGLLRTDNQGESWSAYKLLSQPGQVKIYSLAVNPKNPREIFYTTQSGFYKSFDNGENWFTKSLPGKKMAVAILIDPANPNLIYLGFASLKEK